MPWRFGILGKFQLAFTSGGALYKQTPELNYNTWFGTSYSRTIEWEFSTQSLVMILEAIEVDAEAIYVTAGTNEQIVSVYFVKGGTLETKINYLDFVQNDGVFRSAFFQTLNDNQYPVANESKYKSPYKPRSQSFYIAIVYNGTDRNVMKSISTVFRPKMNSFA